MHNQSEVPGGQPNCFPPSRCRWMCETVWPACSPSLITSLQPLPSPSCLAILAAATSILPRMASCFSSALETPVSPSLFLGMMRMWVGATGEISRKAKMKSSSKTTVLGICLLMSLSKIVYQAIYKYNHHQIQDQATKIQMMFFWWKGWGGGRMASW